MSAGAGQGLVMAKQLQRLHKMSKQSSVFISTLHQQMGLDRPRGLAIKMWDIFERGGIHGRGGARDGAGLQGHGGRRSAGGC